MKSLLLVMVLGLVLLTGCTRRYVVTLNNGNQITAHGKPKRQGNIYIFKDATGQQGFVPAGRVREIAPASMSGESSGSGFKSTPQR